MSVLYLQAILVSIYLEVQRVRQFVAQIRRVHLLQVLAALAKLQHVLDVAHGWFHIRHRVDLHHQVLLHRMIDHVRDGLARLLHVKVRVLGEALGLEESIEHQLASGEVAVN